MTGFKATLDEKERYIQYRQMGAGLVEACDRIGRHRSWGHRFETSGQIPVELKAKFPGQKAAHRKAELVQRPIPYDDLCPEAQRALEDFEYFRSRYLGRVSVPWQVEAAETLRALLETDDDEFVVVNVPPGGGKTTLFTTDIPAWLICRERSVRVLLGHRVQSMANKYSGRLRQMFSRRTPVQAKERNRRMGLEVDAEAAMAVEYGPFKPTTHDDLWRREMFTVIQDDDVRADEKESTVVAFGMDSGQLGYRADFIVWDDLVSTKIRTPDAIEQQREWFDDEAETRLEPGGVFVLVGQRLSPRDLYRYCLDKRALTEIDMEGDEEATGEPLYHHIVYPAHFLDHCNGQHSRDSVPYQGHFAEDKGGCLLDPKRNGYKKLATKMAKGKHFEIVYQQRDVDPGSVLVPDLHIAGGVDPSTGEQFVGCWDPDRRIGELPKGIGRPLLSVATADPSPTKYWSIQWWVVQPVSGMRYLMAQERQRMTASEFLDWDVHADDGKGQFTGVMEEWFWWSAEVGAPIQTWIVEANAAQTFMFQYQHFYRWMKARGVRVIRHTTANNKADPELGIEACLPPIYQRGLVRLPGSQDGVTRTQAMKLVSEVTRYPTDGITSPVTDDCAMGQWFLEFNLPNLTVQKRDDKHAPRRPGFLRRKAAA